MNFNGESGLLKHKFKYFNQISIIGYGGFSGFKINSLTISSFSLFIIINFNYFEECDGN